MESTCSNCKFYEPILHRGQRYPRGVCHKHYAYRISDKYEYHLSVTSPYEYTCDLHESSPKPVYLVVDNETYLIPPIVVNELVSKGWMLVEVKNKDGKLIVRKEE